YSAEAGRPVPHRDAAPRQARRRPDMGQATELRIVDVRHHTKVSHLGVGKELRVRVDGTGGHAGRVEGSNPVGGRGRREDVLELFLECFAIPEAIAVPAKARVLDPFDSSERAGTSLPELLGGRPDHQVAILAGKALVRRVLP